MTRDEIRLQFTGDILSQKLAYGMREVSKYAGRLEASLEAHIEPEKAVERVRSTMAAMVQSSIVAAVELGEFATRRFEESDEHNDI